MQLVINCEKLKWTIRTIAYTKGPGGPFWICSSSGKAAIGLILGKYILKINNIISSVFQNITDIAKDNYIATLKTSARVLSVTRWQDMTLLYMF